MKRLSKIAGLTLAVLALTTTYTACSKNQKTAASSISCKRKEEGTAAKGSVPRKR